jgi:chromosomal replication initiator protein
MNQQFQALWEQSQVKIKERIGSQSFDTWIKPVTALAVGEDSLTLKVPNHFFVEWLGQHYLNIIKEVVKDIFHRPLSVILVPPLGETSTVQPLKSERTEFIPVQTVNESGLRERYIFDTFVIGKSNEFAYATAFATAQDPGKLYNPLFIYGGVGLGKTHLMQAIGHFIKRKKPKAKVLYIPAENLMNDMIHAIQNRKMLEFKNRYRSLDILLLDDVQFLSEKSGIQEEIFHTFNSLYDSRKQIVLTSDRPPKDISHLEERLVSRFQSGLVADIQTPDLETRAAILKKKAELDGLSIPNDVIYFIADSVKSNIRELEGSLIRVVAFSSVSDKELTVDFARDVLKNIISQKTRTISIELIQKTVANYYSIPEETLKSKKRIKKIVVPRQLAMYLCRELTSASLNDIGNRFGGKDHTTVLHAISKIKDIVLSGGELAIQAERITELINGG